MLELFLEYSTQWKDLFWIIFTLVATLTSFFTYLHVRKSIRQPLYNKVIESQITIYTELLELLKESPETFVFSCDFDLLLKYNLLSHCVYFGCFENQEILQRIYDIYCGEDAEDECFELEKILRDIESITVYGSKELNCGEIVSGEPLEPKPEKKKTTDMGVYKLLNIRGMFLQTPSFHKKYEKLQSCMNNIYLPQRLAKRLNAFHEALLEIILENATKIVRREEDKIINAEEGEAVVIEFDDLFNELLESCKKIKREHKLVRKEIHRLLKIDMRW